MNKQSPWLLPLLLVLGALPLSLRAEDNAKFIEGTWRLSGQLPSEGKRPGMSWFLEWTFSAGTFLQTGYPPIAQKGKYRVVQDQGNVLTLELHDQSGNFGTKDQRMEISVNREAKTLRIQGKDGFTRTEPRKP